MKKSMWLFSLTLLMSILIVLSSNNWISMWMGLELNMMSFIPLLLYKINKSSAEAAMIYFLVQSVSSMILLFMIIINLMKIPLMDNISSIIISMSILIKLGAAPFHKWMPDMLSKMSWNNCLLLMTWQKIAPLLMISNINNNNFMINISIIWSVMMGSLGGINQSSLRKMMGYSSINHLGWMLAINKSMNLWMMYLIIYSLMMTMTCYMFNYYKMYFINQISNINMNPMEKISMFIMMLSMGGLPPFFGFLPKWITIQSMMNSKEYLILLIMIMFSLITLMYYIRIMTNMIMSHSATMKWIIIKHNNKLTLFMMLINMSLPFIIISDIM